MVHTSTPGNVTTGTLDRINCFQTNYGGQVND
jgi:hypothetical protein